MTRIMGIVNLTRDSFSDGGLLVDGTGRVDVGAAIRRARALAADGADVIDIGAESSHPDAEDVSADEEIDRLTPVVTALVASGLAVSVDTWKPRVMAAMVRLGVSFINDITGLGDPGAVAAVGDSAVRVIVMHSRCGAARASADAGESDADPAGVPGRIVEFFRRRIGELASAGLDRGRLILDPGMGYFLGRTAEPSLAVLRELPRLRALGLPVCVSTSRKSFIGEVLGRAVAERGAGTLATELWAARAGADYIRTHDVRALRDGLRMTAAIEACCGVRQGVAASGG